MTPDPPSRTAGGDDEGEDGGDGALGGDGGPDHRLGAGVMEVPQGRFRLSRPDAGPRSPLRAWDAADEMALRHLDEIGPGEGPVLIVGDAWGALSVALADHLPTTVVDSSVSRRALLANLTVAGRDIGGTGVISPLDLAPIDTRADGHDADGSTGEVGTVVLKVPRERDVLEDTLLRLSPHLHRGTRFVTAGMTRDVHRSTLDLLERVVGPTTTTRAVRKARLALSEVSDARDLGPSPWPRTTHQDPPGLDVTGHAGVFGARRLDAGTATLLSCLPEPGMHRRVVDLGCGTGVVGTVVALRDPEAELTFVDDSARAVASATATFGAACPGRPARLTTGDALEDLDDGPLGPVDLVVVNPPFHRGHSQGDATAWRMFAQARHGLAPGGELLVVGNRHLAHHAKLRRLFGSARVEVAASDPRYIVLRATAPG